MRVHPVIATLGCAFSLTACEVPESVQVGSNSILVQETTSGSTAGPLDEVGGGGLVADPGMTVCNPFDPSAGAGGGGSSGDLWTRGLKAKLYSLPTGAPHYGRVSDYIDHGDVANYDLYFNQVNVPTRPFDQGFVTQNGTILQTPAGNTLYEYFALHFESQVELSTQDSSGRYQFALLADDGAVLRSQDSSSIWQTLVDNDGTHAAKVVCSTRSVAMDATSRLPIQLDYYQGPRYHIAMIILWRKLPAGVDETTQPSVLSDPACGRSGISLFFDSTQNPPAPQPLWLGMLARGWKVLGPTNYVLPEGVQTNPCVVSGT